MSKEFHIFKGNTDAAATNKGFYFQYLVTLQLWIEKHQDPDFEIYCETEDDILLLNEKTKERSFTQIKCYSNDFSLNSDEVVSSLLNFLKLYISYENTYSGYYYFLASASIKPRAGLILQDWHSKQLRGDFEVSDYISPVKEAFFKYINKKLDQFEIVNHKKVSDTSRDQVNKIITFCESTQFEAFLKRIRWDFKQYTSSGLTILKSEIEASLLPLDFNKNIDVNVFLAYLLFHIIERSSNQHSKDRVLTAALFKKLIEDTANKSILINALENELLKSFTSLFELSSDIIEIKETVNKSLKIIEKSLIVKNNKLDIFFEHLYEWFQAIGYKMGSLLTQKDDFFYFDLEIIERRHTTNVLVYGITRPIKVTEVELVNKLKESFECDEVWIVSTSHPTPAAIANTTSQHPQTVFCYNFDELLEDTIDFSNYFLWVEKEIHDRKIDERFIQLGAKKGEFDNLTKQVVASSTYEAGEGGLEGYVDSWLNDDQNEHISILGEFGSGKTWFTLYYTWKQISKYRDAKAKRIPRPRIPILVFLRDFSKAMQVELLISDFFFRRHNIEIKGTFAAFHQLNKMGKLLLIFDGFDEMADKVDKQKMIDNFWELASVVKGRSKAILTCRNEHFSNIAEGRNLFNAEYKNATKKNDSNPPQFEIVELLKFNNDQIKTLLSYFTSQETIDLIFRNDNIVDLLSRPIMIELILDAIIEIREENEIDLTKIYFYATKRKMERDIDQQRTFTSISDKIFFMCELSWEMISNDKLTINYKEFPDIIYKHFNLSVEVKELDYWRYDMRSQSLLIIDDEGGNYKPAHKSLIEFFVAYKFALELGILKHEYYLIRTEFGAIINVQPKSVIQLNRTFGKFLLHSNKMHAVHDFLKNLVRIDNEILWKYYEEAYADVSNNEILLNNLLALLVKFESDFSNKNFSGLKLTDVMFTGSNLKFSDFSNTTFDGGGIYNCELKGANFTDTHFHYESGIPGVSDINGENEFDFDSNNSLISIGRLGFQIDSLASTFPRKNVFAGSKSSNYLDLVVIEKHHLICVLDWDALYIFSSKDFSLKLTKPYTPAFLSKIAVDSQENRFAIISGSHNLPHSQIHVWDASKLTFIEFKLGLGDLFGCCFSNLNNQLFVAGRTGKISRVDLSNHKITTIKTYSQIATNLGVDFDKSSSFVYSLSITTDDELLAIASTLNSIVVINPNTSEIQFVIDLNEMYSIQIGFSRDNRYLASINAYGSFILFSTPDYKEIYRSESNYRSFRFSKDSKYVAYGESQDDSNIYVLDLFTSKIIKIIKREIDCSDLNIKGLLAPLWHIKYYLKRGAVNWFTKEDFLNMDQEKFDVINKALNRSENENPKKQKTDKIFEYLDK